MMGAKILKNIKGIGILIAILYGILIIDLIVPFKINAFGIIPRTQSGLIGIFTSPFLHGGFYHLISNSIPLFVLLLTLSVFYEKRWIPVVAIIVLVGGGLTWLFAGYGNHIGASGVIYGLAGFLISNGIIEKNIKSILIAIVVTILYGGLIFGVLPTNRLISWEGHLFGAFGGVLAAFSLRKRAIN
ncbi:MAG: membrane associated rhomboid family serine protease [Flavobacteriales bacterium]|jgi:membrane associated rhomboid family serine protease|tara:strand:- start:5093 stop:5650 length:558 start_codon:yes stop_codon:yes gene_type:complete